MTLDTGILYKTLVDVPFTIAGSQWKSPVVAATTVSDGNIDLATMATFNADGYAVQINDRVYLGFQTLPDQNGIYKLTVGGLVRATDSNTWALIVTAIFPVLNGTVYGNNYLKITVVAGGTIDVTPVTWINLGIGYALAVIQLYGSVNQNNASIYTFDQYQTFCFNVKLTADSTVQGTIGVYLTNVNEDTPDIYAQTPFKKLTILNGKFHDGVNPDTVIDVLDGARTVSALYMILYWQQGSGSYGNAKIDVFGSITY